ncbi:MAG: PQQ-binding-like beta-propeller repeat protein [Planctomycetes bacterium]|nr:PQQ-binding-like beta-propeller repeat protein [Planctomycetota bacterium]
MKQLASVAIPILLASLVSAQSERSRLYSTPSVPPREALERLNLREAWATYVPTDDRRDGILSFQFAPVWRGDRATLQLLVQTRSGLIAALDAETGQTLWRTRVGDPYKGTFALGFNNTDVVAERGTKVYGVSRENGEQRWRMEMASVSSSAPLADAGFLYLVLGTREVAYYGLPRQNQARPDFLTSYTSVIPLQLQPVQTAGSLAYPSPEGSVVVLLKERARVSQRFQTAGALLAGPGVHEADNAIYFGSQDTNVYGNTLGGAEPPWRFSTGGAVSRTPFVNDEDVYAHAEGRGLFRLRRRTFDGKQLAAHLVRLAVLTQAQVDEVTRELGPRGQDSASLLSGLQRKGYLTQQQRDLLRYRSGEEVWRFSAGAEVLAVNPKFVYATDRSGRLVILDRDRGRELSRYNVRDFVVPTANELTDRIYLAANSGLVVCLHDRAYAAPVSMKKLLKPEAALEPKKPPSLPGGGDGRVP